MLPPPQLTLLMNRSLRYRVPQSAQEVVLLRRRRLHGGASAKPRPPPPPSPSQQYSPIISGTIPPYGRGLAVQQYAEVRRTFTPSDVIQFGHLVGDSNPLHSSIVLSDHGGNMNNNNNHDGTIKHLFHNDETLVTILRQAGLIQFVDTPLSSSSDTSISSSPLVHGMLVSSLFSCIFGTLIPGSIYRSQSLTFHSPIFANDNVIGRVQVTKIRPLAGGSTPSIAPHPTENSTHQNQQPQQIQRGLLVICDTTVFRDEEQHSHHHDNNTSKGRKLCIQGHAHVWLPTGTTAEDEATNTTNVAQEGTTNQQL